MQVYHSISFQTIPAPALPLSRRDPSVQNDIPSLPSMCFLATFAASSLSPTKGPLSLGNSACLTYSVCSVLDVTLMPVPSASVLASLCPRPSHLAAPGHVHASFSYVCSPGYACSSPSHTVTGRMSLVGCVIGAVSSRSSYFCCLLFSREIVRR